MVDTTTPSANHANLLTSGRATRSGPGLVEDDDEPPSPRSSQGRPQVTGADDSLLGPQGYKSKRMSIKSRHSITIIDPEKGNSHDDVEQGLHRPRHTIYGNGIHENASDATATATQQKQDEELKTPKTKRAKPWYKRLRIAKNSRLRILFTPQHELGPRPTYMQSLKAALFYSYLNILLLFIPVSWALAFTDQSSTLVFVFSCLAIIPLAALLGLGTEQIALRTSQSVGGLLNATLGNVVEMIIGGIALSQCDLELVQSSLLGGQLSNLLLVLGCSFFVGGMRYSQSEFQPKVAQLNSSLLMVSVISFFTPVAFHIYLEDRLPIGAELPFILRLSRGSAFILLTLYLAYLFFQFYSHSHLFVDMEVQEPDSDSNSSKSSIRPDPPAPAPQPRAAIPSLARSNSRASRLDVQSCNGHDHLFGSRLSLASALEVRSNGTDSSADYEELKLNLPSALLLLGIVTVLVYFTADNLVASLEGLVEDHPSVSKKWLAVIVIPIVGNAAEYATAVLMASKGKFNLSMGVAVGSCIQIAFFVIPILVIVAFGIDKPLTLLFDPLETFALFFAVMVVKFTVEDGNAHWLNGLSLISVYVIIAVAFWGFPVTSRLIQGEPIICRA